MAAIQERNIHDSLYGRHDQSYQPNEEKEMESQQKSLKLMVHFLPTYSSCHLPRYRENRAFQLILEMCQLSQSSKRIEI